MTAIQLPCDQCGNTITSDVHTPHERGCPGTDCACDTWVCFGCCWDDACTSSDSPRDSGTSDAGAETLSASALPDGRSGCPRPPTGPAVSPSTNEERPAAAGTARGTT